MPPVTLTLSLSADIDPPLAGPQAAQQLGREIARRSDATLAGTSLSADHGRVSWTVLRPRTDGAYAHPLLELERTVHAVVREVQGWERALIRPIELRVLTVDDIDDRPDEPTIPDLVGVDEFAELLGVNRARFYQLRDRPDLGFPGPVARGVYLRASAEQYAQDRTRRLGRQAASGA
ncbi:hypothetical protein GCM10010464_52260 [Pseudonocardia yunnanensis]|uniref:DNA-binding protein n=1 Tax=Pseudonocardia yunnanensis TaxID=58107 RepID=A0ABW4EPH3_9PSEU